MRYSEIKPNHTNKTTLSETRLSSSISQVNDIFNKQLLYFLNVFYQQGFSDDISQVQLPWNASSLSSMDSVNFFDTIIETVITNTINKSSRLLVNRPIKTVKFEKKSEYTMSVRQSEGHNKDIIFTISTLYIDRTILLFKGYLTRFILRGNPKTNEHLDEIVREFFQLFPRIIADDDYASQITPSIIHELTHVSQMSKSKVNYKETKNMYGRLLDDVYREIAAKIKAQAKDVASPDYYASLLEIDAFANGEAADLIQLANGKPIETGAIYAAIKNSDYYDFANPTDNDQKANLTKKVFKKFVRTFVNNINDYNDSLKSG